MDAPNSSLPADEELRAHLTAMSGGDTKALSSLVDLVGPWLLPVVERLCGGDSSKAGSLCERLFVEIWRLSPCYDANFGPALAWMLLLLRELAEAPSPQFPEPLSTDSKTLARLWFGELETSDGA
jgi:hypothetical protein